jgi:putative nucleotidyltransferase with HDIG domain
MQQIEFGLISIIAMLFEKKDAYTASHQKHVTEIVIAIADLMNLDQNRKENLKMASYIHDIGKISMPIEILSKPSRLDVEEFNLLKLHPEIGYNILLNAKIPVEIASIILQHHEKINGSGYPFGLVDNQISLEAKILSVADVVEAVASKRPYRVSLGVDKAIEVIMDGAGIFFDVDVVSACREVLNRNSFSFNFNY